VNFSAKDDKGVETIGQRFVRPEFQLLVALYAIHFAVWVPTALRLSTRASFSQVLLVLAPLSVCYSMPAIWLGFSYAFRKNNPLSQDGPSFLPMVHLCLLAFTLLFLALQAMGIFHVT
jgi:hypothetical protein